MIDECKAHVEQALRAAGIQRIYKEAEALHQHNPLPYAVILLDGETLRAERQRVAVEDNAAAGTRTYRRQVARRNLPVTVQVADRQSPGDVVAAFLAALSARILDPQGNAILVTPGTAQVIDDPSVLSEKVALELRVEFDGGVYTDQVVGTVPLSSGLAIEPEVLPPA